MSFIPLWASYEVSVLGIVEKIIAHSISMCHAKYLFHVPLVAISVVLSGYGGPTSTMLNIQLAANINYSVIGDVGSVNRHN